MRQTLVQLTRNTVVVYSAEIISRLFTFLFLIYAARLMNVEHYGEFSYALAILMIVGVISEFGASSLLVKIVAQSKNINNDFSVFTVIRVVITVISVSVLIAFLYLSSASREIMQFSLLMGVGLVLGCYGQNIGFIFRGQNKMHLDGLIRITLAFFSAFLGVLALKFGFGLSGVGWAYLLSYLYSSILAHQLNRKNPAAHFILDRSVKDYLMILKAASPFFAWTLISIIYGKADIIILQHIKCPAEVGLYSAAMRVVEAVFIIPMAFYMGILPIISRLIAEKDIKTIEFVSQSAMKYMTYIGIFICGFIALNSDKVIEVLYASKEYSGATLPLQILSLGNVFSFLYIVLVAIVAAGQSAHMTVWLSLFATIANVMLNLFFVSKYGVVGASSVRFFTEFIGLALLTYYVNRTVVRVRYAKFTLIGCIAGGVSGLLVLAVKSLLLLPLYLVIYIAVIYLLKGVSREEFTEIAGLLKASFGQR